MTAQEEELTPAVCPRCGEDNSAAARFCSSRGNRLDSGAAPAEERKLVSILFVDLVGFTSLSERADPDRDADARTALSSATQPGDGRGLSAGRPVLAVLDPGSASDG